MPRPRTPTNVLALRGAFTTHPERAAARSGEPVDERALGAPPERLTVPQRAAWREVARLAPWLACADRLAVEMVAVLLTEFRTAGAAMENAKLTRLETLLGRLGLTPADRSRVTAPPVKPKGNRFADRGKRPLDHFFD